MKPDKEDPKDALLKLATPGPYSTTVDLRNSPDAAFVIVGKGGVVVADIPSADCSGLPESEIAANAELIERLLNEANSKQSTPTSEDASMVTLGRERRDSERLDWLINQGPPGAADGMGLNEETWDVATLHASDGIQTDALAVRAAIDAAMSESSAPQSASQPTTSLTEEGAR